MGMTSGCPLHNLVPEWNDLVYTGTGEQAYNRLKKDEQLPGVHIKGMSCTMRSSMYLRTLGGCRYRKENEHGIIERTLMSRAMRKQNHRESALERKSQSSVPVLPDLQWQTS